MIIIIIIIITKELIEVAEFKLMLLPCPQSAYSN
jgi:hypothetical protein